MDPYYWNRYPQWYQAPYDPRIYFPPQYPNPYFQKPPTWGVPEAKQAKHPHLNPALAADSTHIRYDLRKPVREGIMLSTYQQVAFQPAFARTTYDVRIISKAFPWSIDIRAPSGSVVTCGAILEGLHAMLQEQVADSEWGMVVHDKSKKETVEKAAKERHGKEKGKKDARLKRIDWLGETTAFKGLERDDEFEKKRLLPGRETAKETWVVKFGKP